MYDDAWLAQAELSLPLAVLVECRPGVTRWQRHVYRPLAVAPASNRAAWEPLRSENDRTLYHAGTVLLTLHRKETPAYIENLHGNRPGLYVVLEPNAAPDATVPWRLALLTASPWEAQARMEGGEAIVEAMPLPNDVLTLIARFVERHHVEEPFKKRRRTPHAEGDATPFARPPGWRPGDDDG